MLILTPLCLGIAIYALTKNPFQWRKWLPVLIVMIGVITYAYTPTGETDLTRYFTWAEAVSQYRYIDAYSYFGKNWNFDSSLWVMVTLMWVAGKIKAVHILPMMAVMCVYGTAFYITCDVAEMHNSEKKIPIVMLMQVMILPYISITSNLRCVWAFSLIILAAYLDMVKKERNGGVMLLYVLPLFIHSAAIVILLLRLLAPLGRVIKILFVLVAAFFPQILAFLSANTGSIPNLGGYGSVIANAIVKADWYMNHTEDYDWAVHVANSRYQQINRIYLIVLAILVCFVIWRYLSNAVKKELKGFISFTFLLSIMTIAFSWFVVSHLWRFSAATFVAIGSVAIQILSEEKRTNFMRAIIKVSPLLMIIGLALQLWNSQYSINYLEWGADILLTNVYTIIFDVVKGLLLA